MNSEICFGRSESSFSSPTKRVDREQNFSTLVVLVSAGLPTETFVCLRLQLNMVERANSKLNASISSLVFDILAGESFQKSSIDNIPITQKNEKPILDGEKPLKFFLGL